MIALPHFPNRLGWAVPALCLLSFGAAAQEPVIPVQLVAVQFTTLSAELPGKIDRITVKEGDRFKEGQTLVAFDCVIQRAQLDEAQAVLGAAEKSKAVHKRLLELNSAGTLETEKSASDAAVAQAAQDAAASGVPAPVVLLSPACASYDQFQDFEQRGDAFRTLVSRLPRDLKAAS